MVVSIKEITVLDNYVKQNKVVTEHAETSELFYSIKNEHHTEIQIMLVQNKQ